MSNRGSEERLLVPLKEWLLHQRRIREDSILIEEFTWLGRRVDVATLSASGSLCAYELKVADNRRALEQANFNRLAFDRSYVVTEARPNPANIALAERLGIGVLYIVGFSISVLTVPHSHQNDPIVRERVLKAIRKRVDPLV